MYKYINIKEKTTIGELKRFDRFISWRTLEKIEKGEDVDHLFVSLGKTNKINALGTNFSISTIDQLEVKNERFNWKKDENNNIVMLSKHTEIIKNPFDSVYRVTLTK